MKPSRDGNDDSAEGDKRKIETQNAQIDVTVDKLNPKYDRSETAYTQNCTGVVQAYELQRRGTDAQPKPLEEQFRSDKGGGGGRPLSSIEAPWGGRFVNGDKAEIEKSFTDEGSRGVVYIAWNRGGAHVFNVENVGGHVRFVDGQPNPGVKDASRYFDHGHSTAFLRLDDKTDPKDSEIAKYVESEPQEGEGNADNV